jgi:hypothetical protein
MENQDRLTEKGVIWAEAEDGATASLHIVSDPLLNGETFPYLELEYSNLTTKQVGVLLSCRGTRILAGTWIWERMTLPRAILHTSGKVS